MKRFSFLPLLGLLLLASCGKSEMRTAAATPSPVKAEAILPPAPVPVLPVDLPAPEPVQLIQQCPGGVCPAAPQFRLNGPVMVNNPPAAPQSIPMSMAAPSRLDHVAGQPVRNVLRAVLRPFRCN